MKSVEAESSPVCLLLVETESDRVPNILYLILSPIIIVKKKKKIVSYNSLYPSYRAFALSISFVPVPQNWREAFADPKWKQIMIEE